MTVTGAPMISERKAEGSLPSEGAPFSMATKSLSVRRKQESFLEVVCINTGKAV